MPSLAAWLVARPLNAVFALAITMLMPGLATVSGAVLVLLVIQQDVQKAMFAAGFAGLILVVVAFLSGSSPILVLIGVATFWLPILALAGVMRSTRSLTLTLQLSVIVVLVGIGAFYALIDDPAGFWQEVIAATPALQGMQLVELRAAVGATAEQFAGIMTTLFAIGFWFGLVMVVTLGYWLYQQLPNKKAEFGRFCDLNFGRVVALLLAVTSVIGFTVNAIWIQSIAFVLFAVFWLQGAALVHWLRASGFVPVIAVFAVYILTILSLVIVNLQYMIPLLAVLGYTDAWFRYRHRVTKQQ